jgi:hypothetical protein
VYPDARVAGFVNEHFIPVRVHVKDPQDAYRRLSERFGAQWTPTTLVLDASGTERHRVEGFLPTEDFLAQLALGRAHATFARGDYDEAADQYKAVVDEQGQSDAAPEARYWHGVAEYKATNDPAKLAATARDLQERYAQSTWAKKSTVWAPT